MTARGQHPESFRDILRKRRHDLTTSRIARASRLNASSLSKIPASRHRSIRATMRRYSAIRLLMVSPKLSKSSCRSAMLSPPPLSLHRRCLGYLEITSPSQEPSHRPEPHQSLIVSAAQAMLG